jgi:hypothetical protein
MKNVFILFLRITFILGAWFLCFRQIFIEFDSDRFFDLTGLCIGLAVIISLVCLYFDYSRFKLTRQVAFFIPSVISLLCVIAFIITNHNLKERDNTRTLMYALGRNSSTKLVIDFRENGTYKANKYSFMGNTYYLRGEYSVSDSIIQLDRLKLYDVLVTDRLKIRESAVIKPRADNLLQVLFGPVKMDTLQVTSLYQVDKKGDTIPGAPVFRINELLSGTYQNH